LTNIEICDGIDNNGDGQIDDDLYYCSGGAPAPNTDGSACLVGFLDNNGDPIDGCEEGYGDVSGTWFLNGPITFSCYFGAVNFNFSSVQIQDTSPTIERLSKKGSLFFDSPWKFPKKVEKEG